MDQNTKKGRRNRSRTDTLSKVIFQNREVLAELVQEVIPEFKGISRQQIVKALEKREEFPRGLNTEAILPNMGTVEYDMLYRIPIPGKGKGVNILVNIESQSHPDPGYPLDRRGEFYVSSVFSAQKNDIFEHSEYGKLEKTYSLWIVLNAPKRLRGKVLSGPRGWHWLCECNEPVPPSLTNIILMFMGDDETKNGVQILDLIALLLGPGDPQKKMHEARKFNIRLNNGYIEKVKALGETEDGFYQAGVCHEREVQRERLVSILTEAVIKHMDRSFTLDESLDLVCVPKDCIDEVREAVAARGNRNCP